MHAGTRPPVRKGGIFESPAMTISWPPYPDMSDLGKLVPRIPRLRALASPAPFPISENSGVRNITEVEMPQPASDGCETSLPHD